MEFRCKFSDLNGSEMAPGWSWDVNPATWMQVRGNLFGGEIQISWPGSGFDIWVGLRWDLDWVEVHIMRPEYGEMGLGWSWDEIFWTWMDVGCNNQDMCWGETWFVWRRDVMQVAQDLDGFEMHISRPGCVWDWTWMELRWHFQDLDGDETSLRWMWDANIGACVKV